MLPQIRGGKLEEEFSRPVESIMRCEDFKSNFARKLSNRFVSRSPVSPANKDSSLKLLTDKKYAEKGPENVPESIEHSSQLSKNINTEQNGEAVKPPDKALPKNDIRTTEVTALNMEVETLRWQLAQTEANRQMHIALLRQIVTFLNRVKEHIEFQNNAPEPKKDTLSTNGLARSFNFADLPRSRSVVHVNKHLEYTLSTPKKISTRKISKSISNVNGFKDCHGIWNQSKLSLTPQTENTHKITEEMTRLITLANTVLSTKLPDLACTCNDHILETNTIKLIRHIEKIEQPKIHEPIASFDMIEEDATNTFIVNSVSDCTVAFSGTTKTFIQANDKDPNPFIVSPSTLTCGLETEFTNVKLHEKEQQNPFSNSGSDSSINKSRKLSVDKRNDYNSSNFIEDESGFSSMNSFQEIGIPIISIIPPSPSKEMGYMEDIPDILDESEKWKSGTLDLEKQTVKVFWV